MSPEKSAQPTSHAAQDAAGRTVIDEELELGASAADAAAKKKKEIKSEQPNQGPKYNRRYI